MRREGSPWRGMGVVFLKELSDHLTSVRMRVLEWLVVLTGIAAIYSAISQIREVTAEDPFLFLRLFTRAGNQLPLSFVSLLSFLVPLVALGLLVIGLGLVMLGLPPSLEEMARAFIMLGVTIIYAGVWLALAMLFSIVFRSPATAALVALGLWLFLTILWPLLSPAVAAAFASGPITSAGEFLNQLGMPQAFARVSPGALYGEIVSVLLDPSVRSTQQPLLASMGLQLIERGAIPGAPLPLLQSVLVVWAQIVSLIAATILLFVIGYVVFQRQEVRA